ARLQEEERACAAQRREVEQLRKEASLQGSAQRREVEQLREKATFQLPSGKTQHRTLPLAEEATKASFDVDRRATVPAVLQEPYLQSASGRNRHDLHAIVDDGLNLRGSSSSASEEWSPPEAARPQHQRDREPERLSVLHGLSSNSNSGVPPPSSAPIDLFELERLSVSVKPERGSMKLEVVDLMELERDSSAT
ncbi:unnamed protein product, partial [Polarella glacialis]